jgi:hypothetical protein
VFGLVVVVVGWVVGEVGAGVLVVVVDCVDLCSGVVLGA